MSKPTVPTTEAIEEEIKQRLETDDKMKAWFQQFEKYSCQRFISIYSLKKHRALQYPDDYADEFKPKNKVFNELAREALGHIQQKKLFNLQCQWRAGQIELPIVEYTYDFQIYGRDAIMDCPFLPPVEMDEVELFIQFLKSPESNHHFEFECEEWQDYHTFKEEYASDYSSQTPDWYEFYDGKRGTGYLLTLPDLKGEKEDYYRAVVRGDQNPGESEYEPDLDPDVDKPHADETKHEIEYAKRFEDPETAEIIISHIKGMDLQERHQQLDEYYEYLKDIPHKLPFVQHDDWRESLRLTALQYKKEHIADALPRVWRRYIREVGEDREAYMHRRLAQADKDLDKLDSFKIRSVYDFVKKAKKMLGEE